jgi:hypothetical protein
VRLAESWQLFMNVDQQVAQQVAQHLKVLGV